MYLEHFGLSKRPFEQLPDPDFLFLSDQHEEALTSIGFAVAIQDSFVVVTGEIGSGKTTLLHAFLREHLDDAEVAFVTQTRLSDVELLQAILVEFGESPFDMGKVELITLLKKVIERIHGENKQVVIVVDEAQNLSTEVLEELSVGHVFGSRLPPAHQRRSRRAASVQSEVGLRGARPAKAALPAAVPPARAHRRRNDGLHSAPRFRRGRRGLPLVR